jgi:ATP-dependent Lon protease|tara:strand:+ start:5243 stop:5566 length:324 start_codon:yes stop_codon:yes gene_type:complete
MAASENGWNEYSRLVLEQLEVLSVGIDALREEMQTIRQELAIMKSKEDKVTELKAWKEKIDEVASPSQFKALVDEVQILKDFKTKSVTIFMVVQTMMGIALALSKMF